MQKPSLLIVGAFPPPEKRIYGGIVTACKTLISSSFSQKFDISTLDTTQASNPAPHFFLRLFFALKRFAKYIRYLSLDRPDCILIFTSSGAGLLEKGLLARLGRLCDIPVLLFPRGGGVLQNYDKSIVTRTIANFAYRKPSKILCQESEWQLFLNQKIGRRLEDLPIVPNWTATAELMVVGSNRTVSPQKKLRLLFVGWLEKEKGIFELLEAHRNLLNKYELSLKIIGDGTGRELANQVVKKNKIADSVTFSGWQRNDELINAYRDADIFVLPSWAEGLPNSMIEAMAAGLPVIVTSVGNIPSVIENYQNGVLVEPKSPLELTNAIEMVCSDHEFRANLGYAAHIYAAEQLNIESAVDKLDVIINSVL